MADVRRAVVTMVVCSLLLAGSVLAQGDLDETTAVNLIANGQFTRGLAGWQWKHWGGVPSRPWAVNTVWDGLPPPCLRIWSVNGTSDGSGTAARQVLSVRAADYRSLFLSAEVQVRKQSLPGGGWGGTGEFPANIFLCLEDRQGDPYDPISLVAFYCTGTPLPSHHQYWWDVIKLPARQWYYYRSPNLVWVVPPNATITEVWLSGTGWDYVSCFDNVRLAGVRW